MPYNEDPKWQRVTHSYPCPICKKPDWCCVRGDGKAAYCMRVESGQPVTTGGWVHDLTTPLAASDRPPPQPKKERLPDRELNKRFAPLAHNLHRHNTKAVERLADQLGVARWALDVIGVGYGNVGGWCWTFPERNHHGQVIGINRRFPNGKKFAVKHSGRGLTYCDDWQSYAGPIFVVEGGTDVAACLTLGLCTIGRLSCSGGIKYLTPMLSPMRDRRILIMGERDAKADGRWPGKQGAKSIWASLRKSLRRHIEWHLPPDNAKDMRDWLNSQKLDVNDRDACFAIGRQLFR